MYLKIRKLIKLTLDFLKESLASQTIRFDVKRWVKFLEKIDTLRGYAKSFQKDFDDIIKLLINADISVKNNEEVIFINNTKNALRKNLKNNTSNNYISATVVEVIDYKDLFIKFIEQEKNEFDMIDITIELAIETVSSKQLILQELEKMLTLYNLLKYIDINNTHEENIEKLLFAIINTYVYCHNEKEKNMVAAIKESLKKDLNQNSLKAI